MEPKRMKIVEFDDEGRPVVRQGPSAEPRASVSHSGLVKVVSFDDDPPSPGPDVPAPGVGPRIKVREFDGTPRPGGALVSARSPHGASMKIVEFGDDGAPIRCPRGGGGWSDIKIVEFD